MHLEFTFKSKESANFIEILWKGNWNVNCTLTLFFLLTYKTELIIYHRLFPKIEIFIFWSSEDNSWKKKLNVQNDWHCWKSCDFGSFHFYYYLAIQIKFIQSYSVLVFSIIQLYSIHVILFFFYFDLFDVNDYCCVCVRFILFTLCYSYHIAMNFCFCDRMYNTFTVNN